MQGVHGVVCWSYNQWKNHLVPDQKDQVCVALGEPVAVDMDEMFNLLREIQSRVVEAYRVWTKFMLNVECSRIRRKMMGKRKSHVKARSKSRGIIRHRVWMPWERESRI